MKSFFIFLGACGFAAIVGMGTYLCVGIPANSQEVVKEIQLKQY